MLDEPESGGSRAHSGYAISHAVLTDVVDRHVEARMVEHVQKVRLQFQQDALPNPRHLHRRNIETLLERSAEDIAAGRAEPRLQVVAGLGSLTVVHGVPIVPPGIWGT